MKKAIILLTCVLLVFSLSACSGNQNSSSGQTPSAMEILNVAADKNTYENLTDVEANSAIIVEGIVKKNLGQEVNTYYDPKFKKDLPTSGWTNWQVEVTKVYKGDVKVGDKITYGQDYYIRDYGNGKKQLISITAQKPVQLSEKYLLFLSYDEGLKKYCATGDYEGKFAIPSDELKEKGISGTVTQTDLDLYENEKLFSIQSIYKEVVEKYFK